MNEKRVYDIITIIFIVILAVFGYLAFKSLSNFGDSIANSFGRNPDQNAVSQYAFFKLVSLISTIVYSILIIILAIRKDKGSTAKKTFMIIACILLPGVIPLVYYWTGLRKQLSINQN